MWNAIPTLRYNAASLPRTSRDFATAVPGIKRERLEEFVAWANKHITGDEKGQAQIFLDRFVPASDRQ